MAYPLTAFPKFLEFRKRLEEQFSCHYKQLEGVLYSPAGETKPISYFERVVEGETLTYVVVIEDDIILTPTVIRSICNHLKIDPTPFGLHLG